MSKSEWIKGVREYLDEPHLKHLHRKSLITEDIFELKILLERAKNLMDIYIHDANFWVDKVDKLK
jgi:hypothetical protein